MGAAMGFTDKAKELQEQATEKAKQAMANDDTVDKAADKIDEATGGKHSDKIDKGAEKAKEHNDRL